MKGEASLERLLRMSVSQLIYLSRATQHVDRQSLHEITAVASVNNRKLDVTGALLFCGGYFLQILEGEPAALETLLAKIANDTRHSDVQVIRRRHDVTRDFAEWTMSCLHESAMNPADAERSAKCIQMISDESIIDRIGNDAHQLLVDLQTAIATESATLARAG